MSAVTSDKSCKVVKIAKIAEIVKVGWLIQVVGVRKLTLLALLTILTYLQGAPKIFAKRKKHIHLVGALTKAVLWQARCVSLPVYREQRVDFLDEMIYGTSVYGSVGGREDKVQTPSQMSFSVVFRVAPEKLEVILCYSFCGVKNR